MGKFPVNFMWRIFILFALDKAQVEMRIFRFWSCKFMWLPLWFEANVSKCTKACLNWSTLHTWTLVRPLKSSPTTFPLNTNLWGMASTQDPRVLWSFSDLLCKLGMGREKLYEVQQEELQGPSLGGHVD